MKSKAVEYTLLGVGVTASLGLIFHNQIGTLMIKTYKPTVTQKMVAKAKTAKANYDWKSVKSLTAQEMINARLHAGKLRYIGMVSVPEIGLSLPISKGVNDIALTFGAGTLILIKRWGKTTTRWRVILFKVAVIRRSSLVRFTMRVRRASICI